MVFDEVLTLAVFFTAPPFFIGLAALANLLPSPLILAGAGAGVGAGFGPPVVTPGLVPAIGIGAGFGPPVVTPGLVPGGIKFGIGFGPPVGLETPGVTWRGFTWRGLLAIGVGIGVGLTPGAYLVII
jgi:hypothetical protein